MLDDGIRRAQKAIEQELEDAGRPMKAGLLIKTIKEKDQVVKDIDLREAVWILIGRGTISMSPAQELILSRETEPKSVVK